MELALINLNRLKKNDIPSVKVCNSKIFLNVNTKKLLPSVLVIAHRF